MSGLYGHTTRASGTTLTASIYNSDHQNHIDNHIPEMMDDYSVSVSEMQSTVDPGEVGTESQATSLAGELERLRFAINEITGKTHWYETPAVDLESVGISLPNTIANVLTDHDKAAHDALNIDADTLDGVQGANFLRSDVGDIMLGALEIRQNLTLQNTGGVPRPDFQHHLANEPSTGGWARGYRLFKGGGEEFAAGLLGNSTTITYGFVGMGSSPQTNGLRIAADGTLSKDGNELWHAANVDTAPGLSSSKGTTGYVDLPGGVILQWGEHGVASDSTDTDNFAKTFPNACLQATACPDGGGSAGNASVTSFTTTAITLRNADSVSRTIRWMAIGH